MSGYFEPLHQSAWIRLSVPVIVLVSGDACLGCSLEEDQLVLTGKKMFVFQIEVLEARYGTVRFAKAALTLKVRNAVAVFAPVA